MVAVEPAFATAFVNRCVQNVSPTRVSTHSWTMVWPAPNVRAVARSQSFPTPYTSDPPTVVVNDTVGAPVAAFAEPVAPTPAAPWNATTVNDWSLVPTTANVEVTVTFVATPDAVAFQTSDVPGRVLVRRTNDHDNPPPLTVAVCPVVGPSADTNASSTSPGCAVENGA